ncbi:hypothetical protein [Pseudarthrobacter sp. LT1]|uniref:hypothetical protein n=1 Tax=Pseudarthrobacter sp. LT1 TaxID=3111450 RepID=UPI002D767105|nr:hypothetical protein [Pseudarthrobacter sp. LT1]WRT13098.1 hypothetical protein VIK36_17330 [Pseudarthrobacter sp. LT1]
MRWDEEAADRGRVKFAASADAVEGYGGRGLNGRALHPVAGYTFPDQDGDPWWVIFQPWPSAGPHPHRVPGDILACNDSYGDMVHVVVLAAGVWEDDAEAAFSANAPSSLADAARVAAAVEPISPRGPRAAG